MRILDRGMEIKSLPNFHISFFSCLFFCLSVSFSIIFLSNCLSMDVYARAFVYKIFYIINNHSNTSFRLLNTFQKIRCSMFKWEYFLKIGFVVNGGRIYSYYNLQYIKLDKERMNIKKNQFYAYNTIFKNGFIIC